MFLTQRCCEADCGPPSSGGKAKHPPSVRPDHRRGWAVLVAALRSIARSINVVEVDRVHERGRVQVGARHGTEGGDAGGRSGVRCLLWERPRVVDGDDDIDERELPNMGGGSRDEVRGRTLPSPDGGPDRRRRRELTPRLREEGRGCVVRHHLQPRVRRRRSRRDGTERVAPGGVRIVARPGESADREYPRRGDHVRVGDRASVLRKPGVRRREDNGVRIVAGKEDEVEGYGRREIDRRRTPVQRRKDKRRRTHTRLHRRRDEGFLMENETLGGESGAVEM